jgi:hypothetical protein
MYIKFVPALIHWCFDQESKAQTALKLNDWRRSTSFKDS